MASVRLQLERELADRSTELASLLLTTPNGTGEALELVEEALERFPKRGHFWHLLAEVRAAEGAWEAAIQAQREALTREPQQVAWRTAIDAWTRTARGAEQGTERR